MLISTSRKPSQKTRTFCKNFSHAFGFDYTNRGKSSLRDLLIKAKQLGHDSLVLVYQIKGNPSKLTFYDLEANEKLALLVSVNTTNERLHISPKDLKIRSTVPSRMKSTNTFPAIPWNCAMKYPFLPITIKPLPENTKPICELSIRESL